MMEIESRAFALSVSDPGAPAPVLTGVTASGRLDGVLFNLALRQTYRNASDRNLEVVYTFPLPCEAVLLAFASELNGERTEGVITAKREAERQYEEALLKGDAPVMLEALDGGLYTANLGNLKPGEEIVLDVRFAQLLSFEQGRLRLAIPTTVAPRYGNAESAGLLPQQVPTASLDAEYPLSLSVLVSGSLSGEDIQCPTHKFTRTEVEDGVRLDLLPGASLDRDVAIIVTPRETRPSLVVQARDTRSSAAPVVLMAAFQPPATASRKLISLKLLVDCSGSMGGDSIASAKLALRSVLAHLTDSDRVSLSRFGSTVEHILASTSYSASALAHLSSLVDAIQADLGGTEMEAALSSVFELGSGNEGIDSDVLLITDGEIWQARETAAAAKASGHRVFAIGVGSSPAEAVLRSLAESTGGACEFAAPGESLEAAARRMIGRIRQVPWQGVFVDWGQTTLWEVQPPTSVFGGDTVIAIAGMAAAPTVSQARLMSKPKVGENVELARGEAQAPCPGDSLARIAAARRIAGTEGEPSLSLAIEYQIKSKQTNCILVHQRADNDRATDEAELRRIHSMLAAGWGATSTRLSAPSLMCQDVSGLSSPMLWRSTAAFGSADVKLSVIDSDDHHIPAFLRKQADHQRPASLRTFALAVVEHMANGGQVQGLPSHCAYLDIHPDLHDAMLQVRGLGVSEGVAMLLLANWVNAREDGLKSAFVEASLAEQLRTVDASLQVRCSELFERLLGQYGLDGWSSSRTHRLRKAMARVLP